MNNLKLRRYENGIEQWEERGIRIERPQTIEQEIQEMFTQFYGCADWDSPIPRKIAYQVIREIKRGKDNSSGIYSKGGQILLLDDGNLVIARSRFDVFYKRAGQIVSAYELLKTGLYSIREVSRILEMSKDTVNKLAKKTPWLKCICGTLLKDHKGWCSHRYKKSEKRQAIMKSILNIKKAV